MNIRSTPLGVAMLLTFAGHAAAQSGVTVYGIVDAGVEYQRVSAGATGPATSSKQVATGSFSASRLGFRGTEDLGGGLQAFFNIEHGLNLDDGTPASSPVFWNRRSIVGLSGAWGELSLGRDYTPAFWVQLYTDINAFALYGNSGTMSQFAITGMLRANNGLYYASPDFGGFRARLHYGLGDERATAPTDAGVTKGVSGEYRSPTLSAGAFYQTRKVIFPANSTTSEESRYMGVTGLYRSGDWAFDTGYTRFDPAGPDSATSGTTRGMWAGVQYKFGVSDVRLNVGRIDTRYATGADAKSNVLGLNYTYYLSKLTNLYAGVGRVSNNAAALVPLEAGTRPIPASSGKGSDPSALTVGIRQTF